jgi:excinuclease ABC subunit C
LTRNMSHVFGPIAGTGQLRAAVESLNQVFRLRDCPDKTQFEFNNQQQLFALTPTAKCIRFELGSCPGPCAGNCSSSEYRRLVEQAVCFLQGTDNSILLSLQRDMQTAAAAHSYERATVLRDHLENLQWLSRRLNALRSAQRTFNGVLPVAGRNRKTIWLVLRGGLLLGSATRPDQPERAAKAINSLSKSAAASHQLPANILEMNLQLIMISWFRKHPQLKQDILSFDAAIEYCHQQTGRQQKRIA